MRNIFQCEWWFLLSLGQTIELHEHSKIYNLKNEVPMYADILVIIIRGRAREYFTTKEIRYFVFYYIWIDFTFSVVFFVFKTLNYLQPREYQKSIAWALWEKKKGNEKQFHEYD